METKAELGVERSDHDALRMAVGVVCDDLGMSQSEGVSSLAVRALEIGHRTRELTQTTLHFGMNYTFMAARSHYEEIYMVALGEGITKDCPNEGLHETEKEVVPLSATLARKLEPSVAPQEGRIFIGLGANALRTFAKVLHGSSYFVCFLGP